MQINFGAWLKISALVSSNTTNSFGTMYTTKLAIILLSFALLSCGPDYTVHTVETFMGELDDIEKSLQSQLILAADGDTILLPEGRYGFSKTLFLEGKRDILIQGAGVDKTILSFRDQLEGAEGLRVSNGRNITLADFTIQDASGDNIKTNDVNGIQFINVKSEWTGLPKSENGAYALYPVMCQNVLIDGCVAIGASDAGIYVGQSRNVIVRNSVAYNNVAGIEIENTIDADVYNNESYDNTGGILVFDLPGLSQLGRNVRVFENNIHDNNYSNFAPPGNIVGSVPPGTGMMVLASKNVEVFDNEIRNNKTAGVALISYLFVEATSETAEENSYQSDADYDPYPSAISIYDNEFSNTHSLPTFESDIGFLLLTKFWFNQPEIIYDGIVDPKLASNEGLLPPEKAICVRGNGDAGFTNLDAFNDFENLSEDIAPYDCTLENLSPVVLEKQLMASE